MLPNSPLHAPGKVAQTTFACMSLCPSSTALSLPPWDSKGNHLSALNSHITMLLGNAEAGVYCQTSGQICEEPAPYVMHWGHYVGDSHLPTSTLPALLHLCRAAQRPFKQGLCNFSTELRVTCSANTSPCKTALSCSFGRHRVCPHWHTGAEGTLKAPVSFSLLCFQKNWSLFIPPAASPKSALPVQPTGELPEDPRPIAPGARRWAICFAHSLSHVAGLLSAQPTLQRVTEHQAGIFTSTTLTCDNMIPTSFLPWVEPGEERGEEAVTTSVFHQSNPSLTSYQSGRLSSQCPCSFFSFSVTKQSQVVYLQRCLH